MKNKLHTMAVILYFILSMVMGLSQMRCSGYTILDAHEDNMDQFDKFDKLVPDSTQQKGKDDHGL